MASFLDRLRMASLFTPEQIPESQLGVSFASAKPPQPLPAPEPRTIAPPRINPNIANAAKQPMNVRYDADADRFNRLSAWQKEQSRLREMEIASRGDIAEERIDFQREKQTQDADIRQQRADVYKFKAENPGARIVVQKGGNILAINPSTGDVIRSFGPSGVMADKDRMEMEAETKMDQINRQGEIAGQRAEAAAAARVNEIRARGEETRTTEAARPTKEPLPSQQKVDQYLRAKRLANSNPEYAKYFNFGTNDFTMKKPYFGDQATYDQLFNEIYSEATPTERTGGDTKAGAPNAPGTTSASTERVTVYKDGKPAGTVPANQVELAKRQGYTTVAPRR